MISSIPSFGVRLLSFLRAITSGKDRELQAQRDAICRDCDQFHERPVKGITGKWRLEAHCKACGCGAKSLADISKGKNAWVKMKCPQLKWPGDLPEEGLSLRDANALFAARDRCEYNAATVQSLIDRGKPMDYTVLKQLYGKEAADQYMKAQQAQSSTPAQRDAAVKAARDRAQAARETTAAEQPQTQIAST